jgi:hypothetical protein
MSLLQGGWREWSKSRPHRGAIAADNQHGQSDEDVVSTRDTLEPQVLEPHHSSPHQGMVTLEGVAGKGIDRRSVGSNADDASSYETLDEPRRDAGVRVTDGLIHAATVGAKQDPRNPRRPAGAQVFDLNQATTWLDQHHLGRADERVKGNSLYASCRGIKMAGSINMGAGVT